MAALPPESFVSPSLTSSILYKEMFNRVCAEPVAVVLMPVGAAESAERPSGPRIPQSAFPLSQYQALAKGATTRVNSPRSARRKRPAQGLQMRVLMVDDVSDVTEMIALLLKHAGYEVVTADSASMALQLAESRNFDLVISDIGMPEMNGYELAEALRHLAAYQSIPMIAVTGYTEYDDRGRALQAGFSAHLTKPIDPTRLLYLMNELLG